MYGTGGIDKRDNKVQDILNARDMPHISDWDLRCRLNKKDIDELHKISQELKCYSNADEKERLIAKAKEILKNAGIRRMFEKEETTKAKSTVVSSEFSLEKAFNGISGALLGGLGLLAPFAQWGLMLSPLLLFGNNRLAGADTFGIPSYSLLQPPQVGFIPPVTPPPVNVPSPNLPNIPIPGPPNVPTP